jgi:hypothetical protein
VDSKNAFSFSSPRYAFTHGARNTITDSEAENAKTAMRAPRMGVANSGADVRNGVIDISDLCAYE